MIEGIGRYPTLSHKRNTAAVQANQFGFRECLINSATHSDNSQKKDGLNLVGVNVTETVREAWDKAEKEAGINGTAMEADGKLSAITTLFAMSLEKFYKEGNTDILGRTEESARAAVQKALERMGIPQTEVQKKEKMFYEAFLRYL